jgi:(p)ppGpp synthase/HD superfamily hydrolase
MIPIMSDYFAVLSQAMQLHDGSDMILDALRFATEKHDGQFRRGTNLPYITHPVAVSYVVIQTKQSKHLLELATAAILHDVLEDTETSFTDLAVRFTPLVASLVHELTSDDREIARVGKREYMKAKMKGMSSYALVIKLADRLHNVSDNPTQKMVRDTMDILVYLEYVRKLTAPQKGLVNRIWQSCRAKLG